MSESSVEGFPEVPSSRELRNVARRGVCGGHGRASNTTGAADERALVARTLTGDPSAFGELVDRHHASFLRLARAWSRDRAAAEAIVATSWAAILDGLATFRFDRTLRTWMMGIVARRATGCSEQVAASRRSAREADVEHDSGEERFDPDGRWTDPPEPWDERSLTGDDAMAAVEEAISALPSAERAVLTLRDVEGLEAADTCAILDFSMTRQRLLLRRGRGRVRRALDRHLRGRAHHRGASAG